MQSFRYHSQTTSGDLPVPFIASQTQVFAPQLQNENLNVPFVASETQVYALKLSLSFNAPFVAATTAVYQPSLSKSFPLPFIASATQLFALSLPPTIGLPFIGTRATLTTALTGANNDLVFTAAQSGTDGNSVSVTYIVAGVSTPLTVEVTGTEIVVYVATNASGAATSTASQVKAAIEAYAPAAFLVTVTLASGNDGTGVVTAMSKTSLAGGVGSATGTRLYSPTFSVPPWGAGAGPITTPPGGGALISHAVYQLELYDRFNNRLSDITTVSFDKKGAYRLNRPAVWTFRVPTNHAAVKTLHTDGRPYLRAGYRTLKVRRNGRIVFNGLVYRVTRVGEVDKDNFATVTCIDPLIWWRRRPVRDETGNFSKPAYTSPIAGGTIVRRMVSSSITNTHPQGVGQREGPLGLALGTFDETIPPAIDLGVALTSWPLTMDEMAMLLTETGVLDIRIRPVDVGDGYSPDTMGIVDAVNQVGVDRPGVSFDWATGAFNVERVEYTDDMDTLCNKLWIYLGPKIDEQHWRGLITADDPGLADPPQSAIEALIAQSRTDLGVWMDIHFFDDKGRENDVRKLFWKLWQQEAKLRHKPRELLKVRPSAAAAYKPFDHYQVGDTVRLNVGGDLGLTLTGATQRIYGFDVMPDNEGVERLSEFVTSADQE